MVAYGFLDKPVAEYVEKIKYGFLLSARLLKPSHHAFAMDGTLSTKQHSESSILSGGSRSERIEAYVVPVCHMVKLTI